MSSPTQSTGNANMRSLSNVEKEYLMPHPYIGQMLWWWPGATSQQRPITGVCVDVSDNSININLFVSDSSTNQPHTGVRWRRDPRPIPSQQVAEEGVWDFIDIGERGLAVHEAMRRAQRAKDEQDEELLAAHPKLPVDQTERSQEAQPTGLGTSSMTPTTPATVPLIAPAAEKQPPVRKTAAAVPPEQKQ